MLPGPEIPGVVRHLNDGFETTAGQINPVTVLYAPKGISAAARKAIYSCERLMSDTVLSLTRKQLEPLYPSGSLNSDHSFSD